MWSPNSRHALALPLDLNIGNHCDYVNKFNEPIFCNPNRLQNDSLSNIMITFEQWIKVVNCVVKPFNPYVVRINSCLYG